MCDIESYIYLPFLEETGYVPRHRYSCGEEILEYANLVTRHFGFVECGVFQTQAKKLVWDDDAKMWHVDLVQSRKGEDPQRLSVRSNFVSIAVGVLNWPKFLGVPGILDYRGEMLHTSRWAYYITGGSPKDPFLDKLENKTVAIIGTGACSIQAVPQLASWCKHLYVIQRAPASVDIRDQREMDVHRFNAEVCRGKVWQRERMRNFNAHFTLGEPPAVNLVDDEWTRVPGLVGVTGNPNGPILPSEIAPYTSKLIEIDISRQNRIRTRVDEQVNDPVTAVKLKPWYPSFCKRPLLHDDYLATFNKSNVSLIDTDGKGADRITADSLLIGKEEYKADILIFATGYRSPSTGTTANKANLTIIGKNGVSMSTEWPRFGPTTLHGILDVKFPNLFLSSPQQARLSGNYAFTMGEYAKHAAYRPLPKPRRAGLSWSQ
jgi:cation diffusion facilitator CzcD-associated flavoprotein CzcO